VTSKPTSPDDGTTDRDPARPRHIARAAAPGGGAPFVRSSVMTTTLSDVTAVIHDAVS